MAKKAITTRVHHLAKQLGVNSKDIVKKCADEGVDGIVNHQSAVSAGLSATIAEWFSEAADIKSSSSAVETSAKVDVKKARAKAKKTTRKKKTTSKDTIVTEGTEKKTKNKNWYARDGSEAVFFVETPLDRVLAETCKKTFKNAGLTLTTFRILGQSTYDFFRQGMHF